MLENVVLKSVKDVNDFCKAQNVKMIDFKMVDLNGKWKHITIPSQNFTDDTLKYGIGFDGSNYGYSAVEKSDMVFIPDLTTAVIDPFATVKTLVMLGDVCVINLPENYPFDQYPRNVALRAIDYMKQTGIADQMIIGPEFEFHLFDDVRYAVTGNKIMHQVNTIQAEQSAENDDPRNHGYQVGHKLGYHVDAPSDITYDLRSQICTILCDWGIKVKYHHHEVGGSGQVEIETELGDMVSMADQTMIIKYVVKNAAAKAGKTATFMPKPIYGEAGNGMHVHMLLKKDGKPVFYDPKGYAQLSKTAHYFMGGLLSHASSLCAITNPTTNSYKRLIPGFEAPVTIGYASANRSAVIRIPSYAKNENHKRFELRNPDATCNPYYAYAAILMAGLDGIAKKIDPEKMGWGPFDYNLYDLSDSEKAKIKSLPKNLDEALTALEQDNDYLTVGGVFPKRLLDLWLKNKRVDVATVNQTPHPAEFKLYYNC